MKYRRCILLLFSIAIELIYGQDSRLLQIIESNMSLEVRQKKIDSFLLENNEKATKADLADIYHDLGLRWYHRNWSSSGSTKYLLSAISYTKKAVKLKHELSPIDSISLKRSLYNLGYLQKLNDDFYASLKSHLRLVGLGGEDYRVKAAYQQLGDTYRIIGDYSKAIDYLEIGLSIAQKGGQNYIERAKARIVLAENYFSMGHQEHIDNITAQLKKADSLVFLDDNKNIFTKAQIAQLKGNLLLLTGNYISAKEHHLKVLEFGASYPEEFLSTTLRYNLATVHNSLGVSYDRLGETELALKHFNIAMQMNDEFTSPYENLGDLYITMGKFEKGLFHYQKAIALITNKNLNIKFDDAPLLENLELSPEKTTLLSHLVSKANGWLAYYEHDKNEQYLIWALETFDLADQLIDLIRTESTEQQSKLFWREKGSSLYMRAVEVCDLLDRPKDAFHFMERNKALLLLEDLTNEEAKKIANLPKEMAQREFELKRAIFLSENKLQERTGFLNKDNDSSEVLRQTVQNHKYDYEKFIDSLEQTYPEYTKFKKKADVLSLHELRSNVLPKNGVILHYILNEEDGYGLLTTKDTVQLFKLDDVKGLNREVENLIGALSKWDSDLESFMTDSQSLFQKLIPKKIYDQIKGQQLIVVPDYTLQQIPFEALVVDVDKPVYLFEDVEIGYAYSASLLAHNQRERYDEGIIDLLGIAPITFERLKLPELYFSESEINEIAPMYKGNILLREQATKNNFIEKVGDAKIIHLATHADIGEGDNPWIAFDDSKMYLKEIYASKNRADMVVLSACNTSSGELKRGEGVMSLARGFFYSGAKNVVSTLWPVADEAGDDILINFYGNLKRGHSKSEALRNAKLDYLKNTDERELKHPYYWAGFITLGDNSPLSEKPTSPWVLFGLGLLGTGVLVFGYRKIKGRRAAA